MLLMKRCDVLVVVTLVVVVALVNADMFGEVKAYVFDVVVNNAAAPLLEAASLLTTSSIQTLT